MNLFYQDMKLFFCLPMSTSIDIEEYVLNLEALSIAVSTYHCVEINSYILDSVAEFSQWCDGFDFPKTDRIFSA